MRTERIVRFVGNSFEADFEKVEIIIRFSKKINLLILQRFFNFYMHFIVNNYIK